MWSGHAPDDPVDLGPHAGPDEGGGMILYYAADLLWATRIKSTAEDLGLAARPVRSIQMLEARLADSAPTALILDLETGETGLQLLEHLRRIEQSRREGGDSRARALQVLAFGPHVARELMDRARALGADRVMPRGAFDRELPELLGLLALGVAEG
jgi:CheY-like chemotaxis protein